MATAAERFKEQGNEAFKGEFEAPCCGQPFLALCFSCLGQNLRYTSFQGSTSRSLLVFTRKLSRPTLRLLCIGRTGRLRASRHALCRGGAQLDIYAASARFNLTCSGMCCIVQLENYGSALVDAEKAIELDPTYTKAYYRRAEAHFLLRKYKEALRDFKQASRA